MSYLRQQTSDILHVSEPLPCEPRPSSGIKSYLAAHIFLIPSPLPPLSSPSPRHCNVQLSLHSLFADNERCSNEYLSPVCCGCANHSKERANHEFGLLIIHIVAPRLIPAIRTFHILFFCLPYHFQGITVAPVTEILKLQGDVRSQRLYGKVGRCDATSQQPELSHFSER